MLKRIFMCGSLPDAKPPGLSRDASSSKLAPSCRSDSNAGPAAVSAEGEEQVVETLPCMHLYYADLFSEEGTDMWSGGCFLQFALLLLHCDCLSHLM